MATLLAIIVLTPAAYAYFFDPTNRWLVPFCLPRSRRLSNGKQVDDPGRGLQPEFELRRRKPYMGLVLRQEETASAESGSQASRRPVTTASILQPPRTVAAP